MRGEESNSLAIVSFSYFQDWSALIMSSLTVETHCRRSPNGNFHPIFNLLLLNMLLFFSNKHFGSFYFHIHHSFWFSSKNPSKVLIISKQKGVIHSVSIFKRSSIDQWSNSYSVRIELTHIFSQSKDTVNLSSLVVTFISATCLLFQVKLPFFDVTVLSQSKDMVNLSSLYLTFPPAA